LKNNHNTPQVWPVIHYRDDELALSNAQMAHAAGCAGVFLISMDGNDEALDPAAERIRQALPGFRLGVNYLSLEPVEALQRSLAAGYDATWSDRPGVRSDEVKPKAYAVQQLLQQNRTHQFFGSVAFKYQPPDPDAPQAALLATYMGMIATTSGEATGVAPPALKLAQMRAKLGDAPLALASGITPDNAYELGRFLTHVLVATGISQSFYEFDDYLLRSLMRELSD
jgi:uncharacterized protein